MSMPSWLQRAHNWQSSASLRDPLEIPPIAPDWVVVQRVSSELVSHEFPVLQGKYREFNRCIREFAGISCTPLPSGSLILAAPAILRPNI